MEEIEALKELSGILSPIMSFLVLLVLLYQTKILKTEREMMKNQINSLEKVNKMIDFDKINSSIEIIEKGNKERAMMEANQYLAKSISEIRPIINNYEEEIERLNIVNQETEIGLDAENELLEKYNELYTFSVLMTSLVPEDYRVKFAKIAFPHHCELILSATKELKADEIDEGREKLRMSRNK